MRKGGFIVELLSVKKSTTGLGFVGNLIKYSIIVFLLGIYWAIICYAVYVIYGFAFSGIYSAVPQVGVAVTIAVVIYFVYLLTLGRAVNNFLLGPVRYFLD
jgi:hypothetical protein